MAFQSIFFTVKLRSGKDSAAPDDACQFLSIHLADEGGGTECPPRVTVPELSTVAMAGLETLQEGVEVVPERTTWNLG